jgi:hypothetical protein
MAAGAPGSTELSRELVLWLMFAANFVNRVLVLLGPERVGDEFACLMDDLKGLEGALG